MFVKYYFQNLNKFRNQPLFFKHKLLNKFLVKTFLTLQIPQLKIDFVLDFVIILTFHYKNSGTNSKLYQLLFKHSFKFNDSLVFLSSAFPTLQNFGV